DAVISTTWSSSPPRSDSSRSTARNASSIASSLMSTEKFPLGALGSEAMPPNSPLPSPQPATGRAKNRELHRRDRLFWYLAAAMEPRTPEMSALGRLFERIEREGLARAVGVHHAARGYLASRLRRRYGGILAVAATEEDADRLAGDLRFFLGKPNVVRIPVDAVLPYDGLSPDRSAEIDRLSGLSRLGEGVDAVVVSARGLARKVVPPSVLRSSAERIAVGGQLDRDAFSRRLVGLGYVNAPLVEDPGAFAVRGAIVDFWPPTSEAPIRVELFGDEAESLSTFDPATQRTTGSVDEVVVGAVREFLLREGKKPAAIRAIRAAGDLAQMVSSRIRSLMGPLEKRKAEREIEGLLPAFYEGGLASLFDHLPPDCCVLLDDPVGLQRSLEELHEDLVREHAAAVERGELVLEPSAHFLDAAEVDDLLAERRRVEDRKSVV